jgi:hypothetical protein
MIAISGAGSDVARDSCWALTQEERDNLTLDEKNNECRCMGENTLRENSCNFPGLGNYYDEAIDEKDPVKPVEPGPKPEEPVLPEKPAAPGDPNNLVVLQLYLNDLNTYETNVAKLQDEYKEKIEAWQAEQEQYKDQIGTYQEELTQLETKRAIAIGAAESTIENYKEDFGWTFTDKEDREGYLKTLLGAWAVLIILILILFGGTIFMQKRRDVA